MNVTSTLNKKQFGTANIRETWKTTILSSLTDADNDDEKTIITSENLKSKFRSLRGVKVTWEIDGSSTPADYEDATIKIYWEGLEADNPIEISKVTRPDISPFPLIVFDFKEGLDLKCKFTGLPATYTTEVTIDYNYIYYTDNL